MRKFFLITLLFFVFLLIFPKTTHADSNFSTNYNVIYNVLPDSNTHVKISVILTNLTQRIYTPSYQISVGFSNINNLSVYDSNGTISPEVSPSQKGTSIKFDFNKPATGKNSKQTFDLEFDTKEVAQNIGNVWEVNIPGIAQGDNFDNFNVTLIYPAFLKNPVFIKPDIPGALSRVNGNSINFYKDDLGKSGISIAFGDSQIYDFDLDYDLKDQNLFPISTEIALPPNTNYQNIIINSINPQPDNVKVDEDGNWLAQYKLLPSQRLKINVKGKAKVFLNGSSENITSENIAQYLKSEPYWETNAQNITDTAKSLKTPEDIYQYVVGKLSYDYNRTSSAQSRLGASATLNNPQLAVCLEFSDLFIALSRKIGIPAREVEGFAYTKNSQERPLSLVEDVLHAWPEYYDTQKQSWIMVDPTWGNTTGGVDYFNTFDFDHLAFVVKGISSTYPVPAGGYKLTGDENKKDVNVTLSKTFNENPQFSIFANIADSFLPFLPIDGEVVIKNTGNSMLKPAEVDMQTNYLKLNVQSKVLPAIPPFGSVSIPIKLRGPVLTKTNDTITIRYLGKTFEKSVKITPFYLNVWILGGIISVIFIIILSIIAGRIRRLSVSRQ